MGGDLGAAGSGGGSGVRGDVHAARIGFHVHGRSVSINATGRKSNENMQSPKCPPSAIAASIDFLSLGKLGLN